MEKTTNCFNAMSPNIDNLQKYDVQCPDNHILRSFHLNNKNCDEAGKKFKYTFECVEVLQGLQEPETVVDQEWKQASKIRDLTSVASDATCGGRSVLTGFQLQQSGEQFRYEIRCADLAGDQKFPRAAPTEETRSKDLKKIRDLKQHDVKCPPGEAMRGFSVKPGRGEKVWYEYSCVSIPPAPSPPPPSPPPAPPFALHVASVNLQTSRKDKIMSDNYDKLETHEFHRCMTENNTIFDEDWTSDGKATSKLSDMKAAVLLDPIGKLRENGGKFVRFTTGEIFFKRRLEPLFRCAFEAGIK